MVVRRILEAIKHPATGGLDLDDPLNTLRRREIVHGKYLLNCVYKEWYSRIRMQLSPTAADILEIGSGPGFMAVEIPSVTTSEVFEVDGVQRVENAHSLNYADASLDAIVMTDVLHHIPNVTLFFREAERVLRPGGQIIVVEPWVTWWSSLIYRHVHHEPFDPYTIDWTLDPGGPLSTANGALPWILFARDVKLFTRHFPMLEIRSIKPIMPLSYLASGGLSTRLGLPGKMYKYLRWAEQRILSEHGAMFAVIELRKLP